MQYLIYKVNEILDENQKRIITKKKIHHYKTNRSSNY